MNTPRESLLDRLHAARRLLVWRSVERAGIAAVVALLVTALLALAAGLILPLYRSEYATLRLLFLGAAGIFFIAAAARIASSNANLEDAALAAGRLGGTSHEDDLLNALELAREGDGARAAWTSGALRDVAVEAAAERAARLPIERLKRWNARGRWLIAAGAALSLLALTGLVGGAKTPQVVRSIANPASAPRAPIKLRVVPGNREVEGGASLQIHAFVAGSKRRPDFLTQAGSKWDETHFADAPDAEGARPGERAYAMALRNVKEDVVYRVRVGDQTSPTYALRVKDLPRATGYKVRYDYPAYTGIKSEESQAITADLAGPRGTRATLEVSLNRSVSRATILFDQGHATIDGTPGERTARFSIPLRGDDRFSIRLEDARGRRADLGPFDLRAIPDRPPTIAVLAPGPVEDVARDMTALVIAGATDDHGVRKILLRYKVRQEAERVETLHEERGAAARELAVRYTWSLAGQSLLPGEEVEFQVGAVDGNAIDGPQTTWSDARRLRFPSATEILASMQGERDETIRDLEDVLKGARDLQRRSEEISREVGRSRELSWEQQQEAQKTLEGQERLREQVSKIADKLSHDAERLQQSRALNAELVQKIQELQQVLSQIKDQALKRSIERLQEAMKKLSPQEMERAMQNFKMSQEEMLKGLERTLEMLKQIRTEEMLEAASERAAEMERRQLALNDSLSHAKKPEEMRDMASAEKQIQQMSQDQKTALDSLAAQLESQDREASDQAQELSQQMQATQPEFREAQQSMQQGQKDASKRDTQQLAQQLRQHREKMDKMREQYQERKKNDLAEKMEDAAEDLLDIAAVQEEMLGDESTGMGKRAETQKGIQEATEEATKRVSEVSKQTMFVTPDVAQSLGRALQNQQNAVGRYSNQDLAGGALGSKEAAISINQAAAGLLKGKDAMQSSSSSSGFREAMEQMQGLANEQGALNEQSMGMMDGQNQGQGQSGQGGSRPVEGEGEALARMAAEQEAIRRGLEDAMNKLGQGGGTLGRMNDVTDDMKKVEQDLRSGRLEQDTVERQRKILSRLLDAPRAVEKRDYSRRRISKPGVDVVRSSPGALAGDMLKAKPSLAALLARGGRDPIDPRFRATVDEYFQSILEGKAR